jgi:hypothetical protein
MTSAIGKGALALLPLMFLLILSAPAFAYTDFGANPYFEGNLAAGYSAYTVNLGFGASGGYTWIDNVTCSTYGRCLDVYSNNLQMIRLVPSSSETAAFTDYVNVYGMGVPMPTITIPSNKEVIISVEFQSTRPVNAYAKAILNPSGIAAYNDLNLTNYTILAQDSDLLGNTNFHFVLVIPASANQRVITVVADIINTEPSLLETVTVRYMAFHVFTLDANEYRSDWSDVATETARYCGPNTHAYANPQSQSGYNYLMSGRNDTAYILTQTQEYFDCSVFKLGDKIIVRRGYSSPTYNVTDNRVPFVQKYRDMYLVRSYSVNGISPYNYLCAQALIQSFTTPTAMKSTLLYYDGDSGATHDGCGAPQSGSPRLILDTQGSSASDTSINFISDGSYASPIYTNNISYSAFATSSLEQDLNLSSYYGNGYGAPGAITWTMRDYAYQILEIGGEPLGPYPFFGGVTSTTCDVQYICNSASNTQYVIGSDCNIISGTNSSCGLCGCNAEGTACLTPDFYGTVCDANDPSGRIWTTSFQDCSASVGGLCLNNTVCRQYTSTDEGQNKNTIACVDVATNATSYYIDEYGNQTSSITNVTTSGTTTAPTVSTNPVQAIGLVVGALFGFGANTDGTVSAANLESSNNILGLIFGIAGAVGFGYLSRKSDKAGMAVIVGFIGGIFLGAIVFKTLILWAILIIVGIVAALGMSGALNKILGG